MMSWRKILFLILMAACALGMTTACGWRDFDNDDPVAAGQPSTIGGFTPEEIQGIIETARSERANVTLPVTFPAASFYRFDLKNEKGASRLSTILSYADVLSTPTYGLESTARVLLYEAQRDALSYDFDYFTFERALPVNAVTGVVNAMARQFGDVEFLLRSNVPIGAVPEVASAVRAVLPTLPRPTPASLTVQMLGTGPVEIDLKPRFSVLDNATLMTLIFNDEMRALFARLSQDGLASSPYFF
ncbi:MAG TPA: hypothetical protein PKM25_00330, partial [Candidatus Ozemobacteraceae bacterium]|nr:hypothetical protein [Candidatus Ozemobacteraceae bacterium]